MNDAAVELIKGFPTYVIIFIVVLWIIFKALPDAAQFFGDFLPAKRRIAKLRETMEAIRYKVEAIELSQKLGAPADPSAHAAIKRELDTIFHSNLKEDATKPLSRTAGITYSLIIIIVLELSCYGLLISNPINHVDSTFLPVFFISAVFCGVGCYSGYRFAKDLNTGDDSGNLSFAFMLAAPLFGMVSLYIGLLVALPAISGIRSLLGLGVSQ